MQQPFTGAMVLVRFTSGARRLTRPAVITSVQGPTSVNLHVFFDANDVGNEIAEKPTSVPLTVGPGIVGDGPSWSWPPTI